ADAADAAEQRSVDEIVALEEELERAKVEAATKLEELEGRLTGMEDRAASAEREAHEARAKVADLERELDQARADATGAAATGAGGASRSDPNASTVASTESPRALEAYPPSRHTSTGASSSAARSRIVAAMSAYPAVSTAHSAKGSSRCAS